MSVRAKKSPANMLKPIRQPAPVPSPMSSGRSWFSGPRGMAQSHSGVVSPPTAPAHQVTTKEKAIVLGMKRNMPCTRSSQDWLSVIGRNARRKNPSSGLLRLYSG
jgi:hypothetical protein